MPNLFPENMDFDIDQDMAESLNTEAKFKKSYAFDFEKGEFITNPDGSVLKYDDLEAYRQWCEKALFTERYKHLIYDDVYGQEYPKLLGSNLSKGAIELEIKRMTKETLMVHPMTKEVDNFIFKWSEDKEAVEFEFYVSTIQEETLLLNKSIKII